MASVAVASMAVASMAVASMMVAPMAIAEPVRSAAASFQDRPESGPRNHRPRHQPPQAEHLILTYGPLRLPLALADLEAFVQSGTLSPMLVPYAVSLDPALTEQLRQTLGRQLGLAPAQLAQFLHSPLGELLLSLPEALFHGGEQHRPNLLRQAMLSAAQTSDGLTPVNVLRQLPHNTSVDLKVLAELWQERRRLDELTRQRLQQLTLDSQAIAAAEAISFLSVDQGMSLAMKAQGRKAPLLKSDLRQPGPVAFDKQVLQIRDDERDRAFQADLYLPDQDRKTPLVVISHGLGANRTGHAFFARHLASHGIAAAVVQHPGSDTEQMRAMLQGQRQEAVEASAFVERPRDVSHLLDVLAQRNGSAFEGRLQLERVGVYGHSLGAYTALVLAGGALNFEQLDRDCNPRAFATDLSLALQCRAQDLPRQDYALRDRRVSALLVFDPVSRSILGARGLAAIQVPVFWGGSDADFLTPLVTQQLPAFEQLGSTEKYLGIVEAVQHMNVNLDRLFATQNLAGSKLIEPKPQAFQHYVNALGLAFVQVHVAERPEYRPYLTASYGAALSTSPHQLRFLPYIRK